MDITQRLFARADKEFASFQAKLNPSVSPSDIIGVRVPVLRGLVKNGITDTEKKVFLATLPHAFFEENMIHALLLNEIADFDEVLTKLDAFLPFVDNWAVSDALKPKIFTAHKAALLEIIKVWTASDREFTVRFGITSLLNFYLDDDFDESVFRIVARVRSDKYYINMAAAWFFATALAKRWNETLPFLESGVLSPWVQNKTIRKAVESYRVTAEQKNYLRTLSV